MSVKPRQRRSARTGMSMIECVVAAGILMVAMGMVTSMAFRISHMWMQTGHQRIAMNELSNQIERITETDPDQIDELINRLQPSEVAMTSLDQPELSATRTRDELGDRVTVRLTWRWRHPIAPVELTGWIQPTAVDPVAIDSVAIDSVAIEVAP